MPNSVDSCPIVTILGCVMIFIAFGMLLFLLLETRRHHMQVNRVMKMDVINHVDFNTQGLLLDIIDECFSDYKILYLLPKTDELFIGPDREKEIRADLVKIVSERISETAIERLTIRYKEAAIGAIIADKIYIVVMNYVIEHNTIKQVQDI